MSHLFGGTYKGSVNYTLTGNTVAEPDASGLHGVELNVGTTAGDAMRVCAAIGGAGALKNTLTGSGLAANGGFDIRSRRRFLTTIRVPVDGGANNDNTAIATYNTGRNTAPNISASNTVSSGGGGYVYVASCP